MFYDPRITRETRGWLKQASFQKINMGRIRKVDAPKQFIQRARQAKRLNAEELAMLTGKTVLR
jgi:hypothetical protein